ncbi:MAG TPA: hypothetical protein VFR07_05505 [Mycobacteriales bacterium]|nr:hypothetical protein [Mycobacteriales bacterium]
MIRTLRLGCYVLADLVALAVGTLAALAAAAVLVAALAVRPAVRAWLAAQVPAPAAVTQVVTAPLVPPPLAAQAAVATGHGSTTLSTHV